MNKDELHITWQRAIISAGPSPRPFLDVAGPAGAMVATAKRIGQAVPGPGAFRTSDGTMLHLDSACPPVIRLHALDDLRRKEAVESSLVARIGGPPDFEPLTDFLVTIPARRNSAVAGSLQTFGEGGWRIQQRMHDQGFQGVSDPYCRACRSEEPRSKQAPPRLPRLVGSLHYRVWL